MANDEKPIIGTALKALFAEWEQDYAAAKARDEKGLAVVPPVSFDEILADVRRDLMHPDERAANVISEMAPEQRVRGFHSLLGSVVSSTIHLEDQDGELRLWDDLSPAGKLGQIARDAAYYNVPFEAFAAKALEHVGKDAIFEASLRVAFNGERELTAIGRALPDDGRIESSPLVDQVKDLLADLKHAEAFIHRKQDQERER